MNYVLGFMFDSSFDRVLLIKKNKPEWQAGKLNGVGGKVERFETGPKAMVREFKEETGVDTSESDWKYFLNMIGSDWCVMCFACIGPIEKAISITDEKVFPVHIASSIHHHNNFLIENIPWLVQLAIDVLKRGRPHISNIRYPS